MLAKLEDDEELPVGDNVEENEEDCDDSEDFEVNDDFVVVFCFSLDLSAIHCNQLRAPSSPDLVVFSTTLKSICGGDLVSIFT